MGSDSVMMHIPMVCSYPAGDALAHPQGRTLTASATSASPPTRCCCFSSASTSASSETSGCGRSVSKRHRCQCSLAGPRASAHMRVHSQGYVMAARGRWESPRAGGSGSYLLPEHRLVGHAQAKHEEQHDGAAVDHVLRHLPPAEGQPEPSAAELGLGHRVRKRKGTGCQHGV